MSETAEILAKENPLDAIARQFQGGKFVTIDYTPPEKRPHGTGRRNS